MGGVKRKASGSGPSERPSKLSKRSTSSTVGLPKESTLPRPPLAPVRLGSRKKTDDDVPGLRRAETLPLEGDSNKNAPETDPPAGEPFTSLRKLPSGSSVGVTTSEASVTKLTSKKSSLIRHESLVKSSSVRSEKGETNAVESDCEEAAVVAPPMPPGGLMEIVFSFDTTGSMSSCLDQVRGRVSDMIQRLQADIPYIRLAVFAHGDYCDASLAYVTKWIDFGATLPELCDFVKNVEGTGGGDFDECYELVLRQVQEELSWTPGSRRSLVMIGDATPHGPKYPANKLKIEWKAECRKLREMGARIYAVQAKDNSQATSFYSSMASMTGGKHLKLDEFANIFDMMMAICYREGGGDLLQVYEDEVRARDGPSLHKDLEGLFGGLRAEGDADVPVPKGKASKAAPKGKKSKPVAKAAAKKAPVKAVAKKAKAKPVAPKVKAVANAKAKAKRVPSPSKKVLGKKVGRKLRENVTDREFRQSVPNVKWSKWHLALQLTSDGDNPDLWRKRGGKKVGFRRVSLFTKHVEVPAVFEIGVQVDGKGKIFVVYLTRKDELKARASWETQLISTNVAIRQLEALLRTNSARVFVRRGIRWARSRKEQVSGTDKVEETLRQRFDYAWSADRTSKKSRSLRRRKVYISKNVL